MKNLYCILAVAGMLLMAVITGVAAAWGQWLVAVCTLAIGAWCVDKVFDCMMYNLNEDITEEEKQ